LAKAREGGKIPVSVQEGPKNGWLCPEAAVQSMGGGPVPPAIDRGQQIQVI
jgi:hypothetical protein